MSATRRILIMPTHMPPVPPANRSKNDHGSDSGKEVSMTAGEDEHHANAAEKARLPISANTANKGFFAADGSVDPSLGRGAKV
jgi:hypothetical protein